MSVLREGLHHHVWATEQLLDVCVQVPSEELERTVPAIYGSALDTLRHLVDSDSWYLWCLSGGELGRDDFDADGLPLDEVRAAADRNAADWEALLARDPDPDADIVIVREDGSSRHATVAIRLAQVLHHGSDHRSQVCTALTTLGHQPPEFDVWAFGEATGLASEAPAPPS
jgi:uncharacterized damage-inducible protein DinB